MKTLIAMIGAGLIGVAAACAHEEHEHAPGPGLFGQPPEYVHVLLNPLPVYGLAIGIVALIVALLARSKPAQAIALGIIIVSSGSDWLVTHYGKNAYSRMREKADEQGQQWLEEHMQRGERSVYAFYATALLGIATLISHKQFPRAIAPLTIATLLASGATLGIGGWISKAGGQIRHSEFRTKSAPSTNGAPHGHGVTEQTHKETHPSDGSGGHKPGATADQAAEKITLPDTLEAAWKAIHEHHGELESSINGKKLSDVQSHGKGIRALAKRLVELSHADHKSAVESGARRIDRALEELQQSAETGSEFVMKNNFKEFEKAINELEQQMKKQ